MTLAAAVATGIVLRQVGRRGFRPARIHGGARRAAWFTGLTLLLVGAFVIADAALRPSETLRPGWLGGMLAALIAAMFLLAIVSPSGAVRLIRLGAIGATVFVIVLTAVVFVLDRGEFNELNVMPAVVVLVFVVVPALFASSFLALAAEDDGAPPGAVTGDGPHTIETEVVHSPASARTPDAESA